MITAITIEGFKGIRDRSRLPLKPLTLLFGPNSAGKSSILQVIHYAREILERHNLDPDRTIAGGEAFDLGGFGNIVHGRDLTREIRLRFDLRLVGDTLPRLVNISHELDDAVSRGAAACVERIDAQARSCWVELAIAWHQRTHAPHVVECATGFDGESLASIRFDPDVGSVRITDIHFAHPLFTWRLPPEQFPRVVKTAKQVVEEQVEKYQLAEPAARLQQEVEYRLRPNFSLQGWLIDTVEGPYVPGEGQQEQIDRSRRLEEQFEGTLLYWYAAMLGEEEGATEFDPDGVAIPLTHQRDALPPAGAPLTLGVELFGESRRNSLGEDVRPLKQGPTDLNAILTHVLAAPVELLRRSLAGLRHLGPLRHIPSRAFSPARIPDANREASGLAAWDALAWGPQALIERVSDWMGRDDRLKSGLRLERKRVKILPADVGRSADLRAEFDQAPIRTSVVLVDAASGLEVQPQEVGVGISQLLPVIVAALDDRPGVLTIEQPELHLHPRMQCEVGDLFIAGALGTPHKTIIVETHSEYLILRILRRIRETTRGQPHDGIRVTLDDVAVWYVSQEGGRSVPRTIGVDEHGEFTVPWPDDFFEQDFYERFG